MDQKQPGLDSIFKTTFTKTKEALDHDTKGNRLVDGEKVRPGSVLIRCNKDAQGPAPAGGGFQRHLPAYNSLPGIPDVILQKHFGLYLNYLEKLNALCAQMETVDVRGVVPQDGAFSQIESLLSRKSYLANAVNLHELYFENMGPDPMRLSAGPLASEIVRLWGSFEHFRDYFKAACDVAHGWTVLAWWPRAIEVYGSGLRVFNMAAHDTGGVMGAVPLLVFDAYEHSYANLMTKGDYIVAFLTQLRWDVVANRFAKARGA